MVQNLVIPETYKSLLSLRDTQLAIKRIKHYFQESLSRPLNLERVSALRFVQAGLGINDDLAGTERKVCFEIKAFNNIQAEVVLSLAKWKRMALADYRFKKGEGLYTDMDAIRPDEEILDNIHSIYVDQWDWEKVISEEERNIDFLKQTVRDIYGAIKDTEKFVWKHYPHIEPILPDSIHFIHSETLEELYPDLPPWEREHEIARKKKAVFIIGIGADLRNGSPHDERAPDYDDWLTPTTEGKRGLNGDIIVWNPILDESLELSSMGIRVDKNVLLKQLEKKGETRRKNLAWHKQLLNDELPLSIGGGIGQSRLCMFLLRKAHIGEVQANIWPEDIRETCLKNGIFLL